MSLNGNDDFKAASARISEVAITPASPSPSEDIPLLHAPIIIPTERIHKTAESLSSSGSKSPFLENITLNEEININKIPSDIPVNNPTQNIGGSWYERNNSNFVSENTTNLMSALLPGSHKQPMINNPPRGNPFMQPSSGSSNVQDHYAAYNPMIYGSNMVNVNNQMVHQNRFIQPQQNLMDQNITPSYGENTYRNTFVLQNNIGNNISHIQYENPLNATPNFYRYGPMENNSEYDISQMPPPGRPPYMCRSKYDHWSQRNKGKRHQGRSHAHHLSRDSQIQAQSNIQEPPAPPLQIQRRRKSVDEYKGVRHTKFNAAYSNSGSGKGEQETFVSPLKNLYATGEVPQKTGKGYGSQKFRIPKIKNYTGGRYHNEWKKEEKTESCKEIPQEITQQIKEQKKGETKLENAENALHTTPTIAEQSSISTNEETNSNEHVKGKVSLIDTLTYQRLIEDFANAVRTSLSTSRGDQEEKKFKRIQEIVDSDTDHEHEKPVKNKAEEAGSKTKSKQNKKIIKEKQTKKEITTAEVKVKTKTTAKKKIKTVEKEHIPKETETKKVTEKEKDKEDEDEEEGDKENKENKKLLNPRKISLRKRKRHGGQKKRQKVEALQYKQAPKALKVNKKKVYFGVKLDDNVIETIEERIKIKRRSIKTPEPTKAHKCESELDVLHQDIEVTDKHMCSKGETTTSENKNIYKINMSTIVSKPTEVPEEKAPAEVVEQVSKKQVVQKEVKLEPQAQELQSEAVKEVIKGVPTVLKPNTDYVQEDIELDEQQHEKMKEMSKTIIPSKEFNLLDSTADAITSTSKKNPLQEGSNLRKAKSDAKCSMKSNVEKPVVNETSAPISPSLLPSNEFEIKDESLNEFEVKIELIQKEVIARVGPVGAAKENGYALYICYTQSCIFSCTLQSEFVTHCKNLHGNEHWDGFCNICSINTHLTKVEEAYEHLLSMHSNDFDDDEQTTTTESCENQSEVKYLHMRRLSGDRLSERRLDGLNNVDSVILSSDESICKIVSVKSEQEEVLKDTYSLPSSPPIASAPTSELACPVKAKSRLTRLELIELTDTPLQEHELEVPRKTPYAMACLLSEQKLVHLYKCPERNCTYSTNSKKQFKYHLQQHTQFNCGIQIPCLYCNFKTDFNYIGVHYDIKHGQCQYCCVYCLYRGRVQSYVEMHQEREHFKSPRQVFTVPINPDASKSQAVIPLPPLKNVIPLYECGQLGCLKKFIFSDDFGKHLRSVHSSPLICFCCQYKALTSTALIDHMINHNICFFHCRYCMLGATTMEDINKHLSHEHFTMLPRIVFRCFWPGKGVKRQSDFAMDSPELMEHMKLYSVEDHKDVTPNARLEMTLASTSKELTIDKRPIAISESRKAALQSNEKELVTLCKGRNPSQKVTENDADDKVSDDEMSAALKVVNSGQVLPNALVNSVRPASPIILKKFISSPKKLVTLSQYLASSTASVAAEKIMITAPPTVVEIKAEPEAILDEPLLEITATSPDKWTTEDVNSLQLVPQACSTRIDENSDGVSNEGILNSMDNFNYDDEALQEFPDLTAEVPFSVENITKKQDLIHRTGATNLTKISTALKKYENECVIHPKLERQKRTNSSDGISSNASSASDEANKQFYLTRKEVPVPANAPVSRVACMEKNKNVFDKTINLAPSSFTATRMVSKIEKEERSNLFKAEEAQLPEFVSATKRYVCGVDYCNRLCCEESELRHHLQASHTDESAYRCLHCSEKLSSERDVINVDKIIKHLRLHDLQLYKCSDCKYSHNLKQDVEKHVCDEHTGKLATVIIVRDTPHEPEKPHHEVNKEIKSWHCGMCEYQCTTEKEIISHVYNKHGMHTKYKCNLCRFRKNKIATFSNHFRTDHPGLNADVVHAYYQVEATSISAVESLEDMIHDSSPQLPEGDENQSPKEFLAKPFNLLSKSEENCEVIEIYDNLEDEKPVIRSMAEIDKMDVSELKNTELHGTCGPYGKPFKKQFACPLCLGFKTKQTEDITNHLYKELGYHRYMCTRCGLTRITYKFLQKHSAIKHPNLPEDIQPLPRDRKIEDWVQTLLLVQRRLISDNESLVSGTTSGDQMKNKSCSVQSVTSLNSSGSNSVDNISSTSSAFDVDSSTSKEQLDQRQHCSSKYKAASNTRGMEDFTNSEVIKHSKRAHPKMEASVIAVPTPSTSTIEMRKRKYPTSTWGLSSSSDEVQAKRPALEINANPVKAGGNANYAYMLMCNYCPKQCVTRAELRVHWEAMHKVEQPQFKYKIVRRS